MTDYNLSKLCAKEALKKFYDGSFIERTLHPYGSFRHAILRCGNPNDMGIAKNVWKANWEVDLLGALAFGYIFFHKCDFPIMGEHKWYKDERVEYILKAGVGVDSSWMDLFNMIHGHIESHSDWVRKVKNSKIKLTRILKELSEIGYCSSTFFDSF